MKKTLFALFVLACFCITSTEDAQAMMRNVSAQEALAVTQKEFKGRDVDYFILSNDTTGVWNFFVDAEPMKGWSHECYTVTVPKRTDTDSGDVVATKTRRSFPPEGNYGPISIQNRYGSLAFSTPKVNASTLTNETKAAGERTYAIILSGGVNRLSNYERYWNDCSFIYQTLVKKYGLPKEHIYPIMADGDNPASDTRCTTGGFKSQSLDLDQDGVDDISLAATKANIQKVLSTLATKIQKDDHLFIYVIDHGGRDSSNSYICLWGEERLHDRELGNMIKPFLSKSVTVNVLLGQCFSGGFVEELKQKGCVVATACSEKESSWSCPDIPYDEFVYHWTCAVNEATHNNTPVDADIDGNGRVSMHEAFLYAEVNDRWRISGNENPMYSSIMPSIGENLAFNNIVPSVDLYIKDNEEDTGIEPNTTTEKSWISPSVWVRNHDDWEPTHENPEYSADHQMAYVYVRIHNRGKEKFTGGKWLIVYWTQANTASTPAAWKGRELYNNYPTGGILEACPIPEIAAGGYGYVRVRWALPNLLEHYPEGNFHFCLLAKIMDTSYDDGYVDGKIYFDVLNQNNQASKNLDIIRQKDWNKEFNVYVRNIHSAEHDYTLELVPHTAADEALFDNAKVQIGLSDKIYKAWERGGYKSKDVIASQKLASIKRVEFQSAKSKLEKINLKPNEFDILTLKVNYSLFDSESHSYTFDLIQRDEKGNIVGGETFLIETPVFSAKSINISAEHREGTSYNLTANASDFEKIEWTDASKETIGTSETITVKPTADNREYTVVGTTAEGEVATETISLEPLCGIKSVNATGSGNITVELLSECPENAEISVLSAIGNESERTITLPAGTTSATVDVSGLTGGIYVVQYKVDGAQVDYKKITIN